MVSTWPVYFAEAERLAERLGTVGSKAGMVARQGGRVERLG